MITGNATIYTPERAVILWDGDETETLKPLDTIQHGVLEAIRVKGTMTGSPQVVRADDQTTGERLRISFTPGDKECSVSPWQDEAEARPSGPGTAVSRRSVRDSFTQQTQNLAPATTGWRGGLNRLGFGLRLTPAEAEVQERAWRSAVSQHWPGLRTIAVVNRKGGSAKTPATVLLSAIFARNGGGGVIAWDNNEQGDLGARTVQGPHDATVTDLLPAITGLMAPEAKAGDLARFTHHQPDDRYDVLRSDKDPASDKQMISAEVDQVHELLAKYYRMIFIDTGNQDRSEAWRASVARADQLVIPISGPEESAMAAAHMLDKLNARGGRWAALAANAVVILSDRSPSGEPQLAWIANEFSQLVREVVHIPFDPAIRSGIITFDALKPSTQRAWLAAGAAVAAALSEPIA